jgi:hypothetical protein
VKNKNLIKSFMKKVLFILIAFISIQVSSQTITATIEYQGYDESQAYFGEGEYELFLDNIDGVLDKPIIMIDGFDPGDGRDISMLYAGLNFNGENLADILRNEGYDFIALNAPLYTTDGKDIDGGADYIQRNAMVLVELIDFINNEKVGSEELVVIGPSMGGLIARYGLSYMEQNSMDHETRLYISFDSPHLGANIPVSFQYLINYFAKDQDNEQAQAVIDNVLNSPAAKEMLIDHYSGHLLAGSDFEQDPTLLLPVGAPNFRDAFQTELDNLGFPQDVRNVTMINGSGNGTTIGTPGMSMIDTTLDLGNNLTADISLHFAPDAGETINITDFTTYFIGIPVASFEAFEESFVFTDGLDSSPGGKGDITSGLADLDDPLIDAFLEALEQENYSFIPTMSSLAIINENNWYENPNVGDSPFANTYVPSENEDHVTITEQNAAFALSEIRQEPLNTIDYELVNYILMENPVSEQIRLKLKPSLLYNNVSISVYNTSGQQIITKKIQNPSDIISINHYLKSGIYILNVVDDAYNYNTKMIVK